MMRPLTARFLLAVLVLLVPAAPTSHRLAWAQVSSPSRQYPGQFFTIEQPIRTEVLERLEASTRSIVERAAAQNQRALLIFEVRPGKSEFGVAYDLADFIQKKLAGPLTVAYVPEPLSGYGVLAVLACDEIVMGPAAALGPITPADEEVRNDLREALRTLATRQVRDPDLLIGMLDRNTDLRRVKTAEGRAHYVLAERMAEFRKTHSVIDDQPAWDAGGRGVLTAERARSEGFVKQVAENRAEVARAYNLAGAADDPTLAQEISPVLIRIEGPLDPYQESYLRRRVAQARLEKDNLIFFQINSEGGLVHPADGIADLIAGIKDMKTVAFIDDRALGVATLVALACDDIVFGKGSQMGNVRRLVPRRGAAEDLDERQVESLAARAESLAKQKGHPMAVARAMVDPQTEVVEARDNDTGAVVLLRREEAEADPRRFVVQETRKEAGSVLTVTAETARTLGLAEHVVADLEGLKEIYGLRGQVLKVDGPTWVDALVTTLNTPWMSGLLLFIGLFMLILELKLPGIGLPAITSALAFLLFFWSRYLSGTADQLEIILFLVGLICLALELFVFPGFGVFGMSGILLILISVVMASHTFIWPTRDYEYRQLGQSLMQVSLAIAAVAVGAVVVGRYLPSLPLFNRMVLKPEPIEEDVDPTAKPATDADAPLFFLIGETGRTTTVLRPTGKARFGELLVDVTADGFYIEPNSLVQVIDVQGIRVIVKRV